MLVVREGEDKEGEGSNNHTSCHSSRKDAEEHVLFGDRAELEVTYDVFDHAYSIGSLKGQGNPIRQ